MGEFQNTSKADIISLTVSTVDMSTKKANVFSMENGAENVEKEIIMHEFVRTQKDMFIILEMIVCRMKIMTTNMNTERGDNSMYVGMIQKTYTHPMDTQAH